MSTHVALRRTLSCAAAIAAAVALAAPGPGFAAPGSAICSAKGSGGANPDTAKVRDVVQSSVAAADQAGWKMGVAIGGAGNDNPVVTAGTANDAVYSASTIKVAIGAAVYRKDQDSDQAEDLKAMLGASDNEAANRLADAVGGFDAVNKVIADAGVDEGAYHLGNRMGGPKEDQASTLSAVGGAKFLMALCNAAATDGGFMSQKQASGLLSMMADDSIKSGAVLQKLKVGFPSIANKTGENSDSKDGAVSHDMGIVGSGNHWFAIAVTTQGTSDGMAQIADLAQKLAPLFEA